MPEPQEGESLQKFILRCIPVVNAETTGKRYKPGHPYAKCRGIYKTWQKNKRN